MKAALAAYAALNLAAAVALVAAVLLWPGDRR